MTGQALGLDPGSWYLAAQGLSPQTRIVLGGAASQARNWFISNDSLFKRMGQLRISEPAGSQDALQAWGRGYGWQTRADLDEIRYRDDYRGFNLGADRSWTLPQGQLSTGLFIGAGISERGIECSPGDARSELTSSGVYVSQLYRSGWYLDAVMQVGHYKNTISSANDLGPVRGEYGNTGYGASLEVGRQIPLAGQWFVEPQVRGSFVHFGGSAYATNQDLAVQLDGADDYDIRAGARLGQDLALADGFLQPYLSFMYGRSWMTGGGLSLADGSYRTQTGRNSERYELGAGMAWQAGANQQFFIDCSYTHADTYDVPWQITLGYRLSW
ncbi:MAG: autotransporter outer membrane beta-barrel domain-containing protein [Desulfocapsaceae bacterium]|nr:autotransporter outer membrane beta-barrel domain-containing protein [Desulfocapsaceae bacterium]